MDYDAAWPIHMESKRAHAAREARATRPWLDAPVGADRRCDYCGACIAKGFGVWGRPYIGTIRVEIGVPAAPAYASKSIGYHTACFEKAQSRDDRIRRLFVVEFRENE